MAQWMGTVWFELQPLADYVLGRIKQRERVFVRETKLRRWLPGPLWAYNRHERRLAGAGPPEGRALKTARAENVSRVTWRALGASCRWRLCRLQSAHQGRRRH